MINLQNTGIDLVKSYIKQTHHDKNIENLYKIYDSACNHYKQISKYRVPKSELMRTKTKINIKNEDFEDDDDNNDVEKYQPRNDPRNLAIMKETNKDLSSHGPTCVFRRDLRNDDSREYLNSRKTLRDSFRRYSCDVFLKPSLPYLSLCHDFLNRRTGVMELKQKKTFSRKPADFLWLFLRKLLDAEEHNQDRCIEWTNRDAGEFRIVKTNVLASLWGQAKNNRSMTYDKMARAMRFNYKQGILQKVPNKKLHYSFGEKIVSRYKET